MRWQGKTGGGIIGQKGMLFLFRNVDVRFGYAVMSIVVPFYMLFSRKNCLAIYNYFRERHNCPALKALLNTYKNHYLFGQIILDRFAVFSGKKNTFQVSVDGQHYFDKAVKSNAGTILLSAHLGNFEILGYFLKQDTKKINAVIYGGEAAVSQANRMKIFASNNIIPVPLSHDLSHIFLIRNALNNGDMVSMLGDRYYTGSKSVKMSFLNGEALFPAGPFILAEKLQADILTIFVVKESARNYRVIINPLTNTETPAGKNMTAKELLPLYTSKLAEIVNRYPLQWFNYYNFWSTNEAE